MMILLLKSEEGKCFLLEFMCDIEHIPGKTNIIADGFSRFVHFPEKGEEKIIEREEIDLSETFLAATLEWIVLMRNVRKLMEYGNICASI